MMDILGALAPRGPIDWKARRRIRLAPRRRGRVFGAVSLSTIDADSTDLSDRLYRLFDSGGAVVVNEETAKGMASRGFTMQETVLTAEEKQQLASRLPEIVDAPVVWLARCSEPEGVNLGYCGFPPGIVEVNASEAIKSGEITAQDMAAATAWVPKSSIEGIRVFGSSLSAYSPEQFSRAIEAVNHYDEIARTVLDVEGRAEQSGIPLTSEQQAVVARSRAYLAQNAQPVMKFRKRFPQYVGPSLVKVQQESMGAVVVTTTMVYVAIAAVMVVSIVGAVCYLASLGERKFDKWAELKEIHQAQAQQLVDCASDPTLTREQRWACRSAMREHRKTDPPPPTDPLESLAQAIQGLAPVLAIGVGAYFFGPIVVEAVKGGSEAMKARRQAKAVARTAESVAGSSVRIVGP